jgi:hypothetical protein
MAAEVMEHVVPPPPPPPPPLAPMPINDMEAAAALFDKRTESAKSITPGCTHYILDQWPKHQPNFPKPQHIHLTTEIARRNSAIRPSSWNSQKCSLWLFEHAMGAGSSNVTTER